MEVLIGVDDTDSKESRGTGFRARQMSSELSLAGYGKILGVTRHQLLVHPEIPYTSQNSSNCVHVDTQNMEGLIQFCQTFLIREALPGADVGLSMARMDQINPEVEEWGRRAKRELLSQEEAINLAERNGIFLIGLTGTKGGIIGALAAVGLRSTGNDGRFIWQPGIQLRDLEGSYTVREILRATQVDALLSKDGKILSEDEQVDMTDWVRAVLINKQFYIIVERNLKKSGNDWKTADKEYIKYISR